MELKHGYQEYVGQGLELLIVPYGIETSKKWSDKQNSAAFNRTLWN